MGKSVPSFAYKSPSKSDVSFDLESVNMKDNPYASSILSLYPTGQPQSILKKQQQPKFMTPQAPAKKEPDFFERRIKTQSAKRGKSSALYRQKDVEELFSKYIDASKQKP